MSEADPLESDVHRLKMAGPKATAARHRVSAPTVASPEPRDPRFIPAPSPHRSGSLWFPASDKWNPLLALARIFPR